MDKRAENSRTNGAKGGRPKTQQVISGLGSGIPEVTSLHLQSQSQINKPQEDIRGGVEGYDVLKYLSGEDIEEIRFHLDGWDVYALAGTFNQNVRSGKFEAPRNPPAAFLQWGRTYTKGKTPK